jgi:hypothetical protein
VKVLFEKLVEISKERTSIILVKQSDFKHFKACERAYVFEIDRILPLREKEKTF